MQRLVINVKDDTKLHALMSVLNEINFIEVEKEKVVKSRRSGYGNFRKLFGILRIPLIPPPDSEGIRHPVPIQVARVFRLIPPPLVGA